jgi:putative flippase GtrA
MTDKSRHWISDHDTPSILNHFWVSRDRDYFLHPHPLLGESWPRLLPTPSPTSGWVVTTITSYALTHFWVTRDHDNFLRPHPLLGESWPRLLPTPSPTSGWVVTTITSYTLTHFWVSRDHDYFLHPYPLLGESWPRLLPTPPHPLLGESWPRLLPTPSPTSGWVVTTITSYTLTHFWVSRNHDYSFHPHPLRRKSVPAAPINPQSDTCSAALCGTAFLCEPPHRITPRPCDV